MLFLAALVTGCGSAKADSPSPAPSPQRVETIAARRGSVGPTLRISGVIAPMRQISIEAALNEPVVEIRVREGERIRAGGVLARLETDDARRSRRRRTHLSELGAEPGYALSNVLDDINRRIKTLNLGDTVVVAPAPQSNASMMNDALGEIGASLLGSIVLVSLLIVALYNSSRSPVIIVPAIPPATL